MFDFVVFLLLIISIDVEYHLSQLIYSFILFYFHFSLYIILSGTVSVYINPSKIADDGTPLAGTLAQAGIESITQVAAPPEENEEQAPTDHQRAAPADDATPKSAVQNRRQEQSRGSKRSKDSDTTRADDTQRASPGDETESSYSRTTDGHKKALKSKEKNKYGKFIDKIG